ncbi:unnamed protein product [Clavelina lepadiformis]|uniref:Uncharacterized protein n=1 Tax=Clavelina lepadiformis TaxID=159417 RepID=A0ABP0FUE9_CLALP
MIRFFKLFYCNMESTAEDLSGSENDRFIIEALPNIHFIHKSKLLSTVASLGVETLADLSFLKEENLSILQPIKRRKLLIYIHSNAHLRKVINENKLDIYKLKEEWPILFGKVGMMVHYKRLTQVSLDQFQIIVQNQLQRLLQFMQTQQLKMQICIELSLISIWQKESLMQIQM